MIISLCQYHSLTYKQYHSPHGCSLTLGVLWHDICRNIAKWVMKSNKFTQCLLFYTTHTYYSYMMAVCEYSSLEESTIWFLIHLEPDWHPWPGLNCPITNTPTPASPPVARFNHTDTKLISRNIGHSFQHGIMLSHSKVRRWNSIIRSHCVKKSCTHLGWSHFLFPEQTHPEEKDNNGEEANGTTYIHFSVYDVNKATEYNDEVKHIPSISKIILKK